MIMVMEMIFHFDSTTVVVMLIISIIIIIIGSSRSSIIIISSPLPHIAKHAAQGHVGAPAHSCRSALALHSSRFADLTLKSAVLKEQISILAGAIN